MTAAERKRVAEWMRTQGKFILEPEFGSMLRIAADLIDPPEPTGTVRVRVACAVHGDGTYAASHTDIVVKGHVQHGARLTWVEASVPLPEPPATVEGSAT